AFIPALMHRIPSELRSKACLGESSTRMGDLLGSPRVAPLFFLRRAIIPALMHWIPSELRSKACLGESSSRMGDLLGSPRVAPLFFFYV
ncbi:hypothetical protein S83_055140, partial [Arachis hypogaea]